MAQQTFYGSSFDVWIWALEIRAYDRYRVSLENGTSCADGFGPDLMILVLEH
jgi:hypothetical protein